MLAVVSPKTSDTALAETPRADVIIIFVSCAPSASLRFVLVLRLLLLLLAAVLVVVGDVMRARCHAVMKDIEREAPRDENEQERHSAATRTSWKKPSDSFEKHPPRFIVFEKQEQKHLAYSRARFNNDS